MISCSPSAYFPDAPILVPESDAGPLEVQNLPDDGKKAASPAVDEEETSLKAAKIDDVEMPLDNSKNHENDSPNSEPLSGKLDDAHVLFVYILMFASDLWPRDPTDPTEPPKVSEPGKKDDAYSQSDCNEQMVKYGLNAAENVKMNSETISVPEQEGALSETEAIVREVVTTTATERSSCPSPTERSGPKEAPTPDREKNICCRCWPIDIPGDRLDQREAEIKEEQSAVQTALVKSMLSRKSLEKELRHLVYKSQTQREDAAARKASLELEVVETTESAAAMQANVDRCRTTRNQLLCRKKKSHQAVLETEIKLRQLQMELCHHQLDADARITESSKTEEATALATLIQEKEAQVADLAEDVAAKTLAHKETEEAYLKAESEFQTASEAHRLLARRLEEARQGLDTMDQGFDEMTAKIDSIRAELASLLAERKTQRLKSIDLEEELVKIDTCRKLLLVEEKRNKVLVDEVDEDNFAGSPRSEDTSEILNANVDLMRPSSSASQGLPSTTNSLTGDSSAVAEAQSVARPAASPSPRLERPTSVIVNSPPIRPVPSTALLASTSSTSSTQNDEAEPYSPAPLSIQVDVEANAEMEPEPTFVSVSVPANYSSPLPLVADPASGSCSRSIPSPSPQPICLRAATPMAAPSPAADIAVTTVAAPMLAGSPLPSSTPSPPSTAIRLVDSLVASTVSPPTALTPASFAQSPDQMTLSSLEGAVPFYAQFLTSNSSLPSGSAMASSIGDEKVLYQEIVIGCRKFVSWATNFLNSTRNCARDASTLSKSAGYMKDYLIP